MKFNDLQPEDFPGLNLDPQKFEEWKTAKDSESRNTIIAIVVLLVLIGIVFLNTGDLYLPGFLIVIAVFWLINRKGKQLAKELGITPSILAEAHKNMKERL